MAVPGSPDYDENTNLAQPREQLWRMDAIRHPYNPLDLHAKYHPEGEPLQELLVYSIYGSEPSSYSRGISIKCSNPEHDLGSGQHIGEEHKRSRSTRTDLDCRTRKLAKFKPCFSCLITEYAAEWDTVLADETSSSSSALKENEANHQNAHSASISH